MLLAHNFSEHINVVADSDIAFRNQREVAIGFENIATRNVIFDCDVLTKNLYLVIEGISFGLINSTNTYITRCCFRQTGTITAIIDSFCSYDDLFEPRT